jgi:hypothetical protein
MYRTILFFACFFSVFSHTILYGQNLDKYYTRRVQEGGDIFFILPNSDFKNAEAKTGFVFDITIREGGDSATINFTYHSRDPLPAVGLLLKSATRQEESPAKKLYVDFVKRNWEQRYSSTVAYDALVDMIAGETPPMFQVKTTKQVLTFKTKKRKWEKYAEALRKIFYIINSDNTN